MISQSHDDTSRSRGLKTCWKQSVLSTAITSATAPRWVRFRAGIGVCSTEPQITRWRPVISGPGQQFQVQPPTPLGPLGSNGKSAQQARFNILCNGRFSKECQPLTDRGELKIESRSHGINMNLSDKWQLCCKAKSDFGTFDVMVFSIMLYINIAVPDSAQAIPGRPRQSRQSPAINSYSTCATWIRGQMASSLHMSPPWGLESLSFRRSFRCRHKDFVQPLILLSPRSDKLSFQHRWRQGICCLTCLTFSSVLLVSMQLELLARTLVARPVEFPATRKFQSQSTMTACHTQTGIDCQTSWLARCGLQERGLGGTWPQGFFPVPCNYLSGTVKQIRRCHLVACMKFPSASLQVD